MVVDRLLDWTDPIGSPEDSWSDKDYWTTYCTECGEEAREHSFRVLTKQSTCDTPDCSTGEAVRFRGYGISILLVWMIVSLAAFHLGLNSALAAGVGAGGMLVFGQVEQILADVVREVWGL